jgi:hypothetical protein
MTHDYESDDYGLRVLIEEMQQKGASEREIEAAVRAASRRAAPRTAPAARRPRRLGGFGRRLLGTTAR